VDKADLHVLLLDDESFMLKLLSHILAELGFLKVIQCDNGPLALQHVDSSEPPDLILLDLNMPDMDGVEFVRRLVEHGYRGSLVLISGEGERILHMADKLIRAHSIEILGRLGKPFSKPALSAIMDKAIASRRSASAPRRAYDAQDVAVAISSGQLVNFYQPKVDVMSKAVIGVEALVRWEHPVDGLVFPDQFIAVAEDHHLIDSLTHEVLHNALAQARSWQSDGLQLRMAVNVSMDNLSSLDFAEFVYHEAMHVGVAPQDVVLEVTESRLMLDQRAPLEVLTRLRMKRFRLAIDDFGTGHSSLSQLRDIPFDELKIDRGFVHDAWRDPTSRAIYDASLALGRQLGMVVVAEGVEDAEDWEMLRATNCEHAQGYFMAKPMRAEKIPSWIDEWNRRWIGPSVPSLS
jgi:EAL domain-containing protein (putative c-di-GMP-specific phosphodiesterase class I)/AmiR/NasT family two-component response regulator